MTDLSLYRVWAIVVLVLAALLYLGRLDRQAELVEIYPPGEYVCISAMTMDQDGATTTTPTICEREQ